MKNVEKKEIYGGNNTRHHADRAKRQGNQSLRDEVRFMQSNGLEIQNGRKIEDENYERFK